MYKLYQYTHLFFFFPSVLNINLLHSTRGGWLAVTICGAIDRKSETARRALSSYLRFRKTDRAAEGTKVATGFNDARQISGGTGRSGDGEGKSRIPLISHNCHAFPHTPCASAMSRPDISWTNAQRGNTLFCTQSASCGSAAWRWPLFRWIRAGLFVRERWDIRRSSYRPPEEDWRSVENVVEI